MPSEQIFTIQNDLGDISWENGGKQVGEHLKKAPHNMRKLPGWEQKLLPLSLEITQNSF